MWRIILTAGCLVCTAAIGSGRENAPAGPVLAIAFDAGPGGPASRPSSDAFQAWPVHGTANARASGEQTQGSLAKFKTSGGGSSMTMNWRVSPALAPAGDITVKLTSTDLAFDAERHVINVDDHPAIEFCASAKTVGTLGSGYGDLYKSCLIALPGEDAHGHMPSPAIASGTDHRLLVEFIGLRPGGRYLFTFFAYDDRNRQGVFVFTDVTGNPLRYLNPANAGTNGNPLPFLPWGLTPFSPGSGDHDDGTQYAPDGQYIWADGKPPAADAQYALPLAASADAAGKIVFAETTVTNLYGRYQPWPVLNGFKLELLSNDVEQ